MIFMLERKHGMSEHALRRLSVMGDLVDPSSLVATEMGDSTSWLSITLGVLGVVLGCSALVCGFLLYKQGRGKNQVYPADEKEKPCEAKNFQPDASAQLAAVRAEPGMKAPEVWRVSGSRFLVVQPPTQLPLVRPTFAGNPSAAPRSPSEADEGDPSMEPVVKAPGVKSPKHGLPMEPPSCWSLDESLSQGWATVPVDAETLKKIRKMFVVTQPHELGKGRDAHRNYHDLEAVYAWRLENPSLWQKYATERDDVRIHMEQLQRQDIKTASWKSKLEEASKDMPGEFFPEVGERYLLHGTHPTRVLDILRHGLGNRFTSSKSMFGAGNHLAEDPENGDQYLLPDVGKPGLEALHSQLFRGGNTHPGDAIFYCFLLRVVCGASLVIEGFWNDGRYRYLSIAEVFVLGPCLFLDMSKCPMGLSL